MMSEECKEEEQEVIEQEQPQAAFPEAAPTQQNEEYKDDDSDDEERKRLREICLIVTFMAVIMGIVVGVVTGVVVSKDKRNSDKYLPTDVEFKPAPQKEAPPPVMLDVPQDELDYLLSILNADSVTATYVDLLPKQAAALNELYKDESQEPFVRAASWLITKDPFNERDQTARRFALASIYYTAEGPQWKDNINWLSDRSHCEWKGITCCQELRTSVTCFDADPNEIVELDLHNNNLVGEISDAMVLLTDIRTLFMSDNTLSGTIPGPALTKLPKLMKIYLQHNQLSGEVPGTLHDNGVLDTIFVQGNNLNGTWPRTLCPACPNCPHQVQYFGVDCAEVECPEACCRIWRNCFYV